MTLQAFFELIQMLNIPAIYGPYQESTAAPYISYSAVERNVIHADGRVIYGEDWIELRLVTKSRNLTLEQTVEKLLSDNGIAFDYPDFEYNEEQRIHTAYYNFMLQTISGSTVPHIDIKEKDAEIEIGEMLALHLASIYPLDASITWMTSDPAIATVSATGIVTGITAGTCSVVALIVADGVSYTDACTVNIYEEEE